MRTIKLQPTPKTERLQTDESLRTERENTDAVVEAKQDRADVKADEVLKETRARADQKREATPATPAAAAHDDALVNRERRAADAQIQMEREERKRSHSDFLGVERDATDRDLVGERIHADNVVAIRDEFWAVVSHDLRGYLNALSMNTQVLAKEAAAGALGDTVRRSVETNRRLVLRMNRLINDLLDVSSIEAGRLAMVPVNTDIALILREALDAFESLAAAKGIRLIEETQPVHAVVDGDRLLQVLANLLSNAIKFTPEGGTITVRSQRAGKALQLEVSDSGPGIPQDELRSVFERYRQLSRDRRGLGLGLYISQQIIAAHGGTLWAESVAGAGSTFFVSLPLTTSV